MQERLLGSELWKPALEKYAEVTGLTVRLFSRDAEIALATVHPTALVALFEEFGVEPGLFARCARLCLSQTTARPAVAVAEDSGLAVVGTSLVLEGEIVGAAVAGYALSQFSNVIAVQRWAKSMGLPFDRLWQIVRGQPPVPERRLMLHGELLQVLGDALLRENHRTRQYEEAVKKLQAADAAKDEFLAVLSHELRTPLAAILSWASVLKRDERAEQVRRATAAIERNVKMQSRMVEDLLDVTRIARGSVTLDPGVHELSTLVRSAVEMSAQDIEKKGIRLDFVDAGEPLVVEGDSGRLQQVFRNVVSNAVKFTPGGGSIRVSIAGEGDSASVVVSDTGSGIPPEFLPFVFDMFRQQEEGTRRQYGGLGIGLALVKRLVELHHGTVGVSSPGAGHGTDVTVRLPVTDKTPDTAPPAAIPDAKPSAQSLGGVSILVVEDTDDSRDSLRLLLELLGADVQIARDGREALGVLRYTQPDLILCDLRMPRMDGFEFMRELNRDPSPPHPPVVAMSGLASELDRKRARDAGFESHLKKPFDAAAVVEAVGAALAPRDRPHPQPGRRREIPSR